MARPKNHPKHVAAARELRDRWLEEVNSGQYAPQAEGKYDISKTLSEVEGSTLSEVEGSRQLTAMAESKQIALLPAA